MLFHFNQRSKSNLYGRLLIFMLMMMFTIILASESGFIVGDAMDGPKYGGLVFSTFYLFFFFYGVELLRILKYNDRLLTGLQIYGIIGAFVIYFVANSFMTWLPDGYKPFIFSFFHVTSFLTEIGFCVVILKDIFTAEETHADHIWGAVVVYFTFVLAFSELYEIICLIHPGMLGQVYELGYPNYVQCIMYSLNTVAGIDSIYPDAHDLFKKLAAIESVLENLFLVVILGRLLSHPLKKRN